MHNAPKHVAIIMDGNRRWAVENGVADIEGHRQALQRIEDLVVTAKELGVEYLTLWAWSNKNWSRNPLFIKSIIELFRESLKDNGIFQRALEKGARLNHIGDLSRFPHDIVEKVEDYMQRVLERPDIVVNLAIGYDGRDELMQAIKAIIKEGIDASKVTGDLISSHLYTAGQPDVDLLIRTGGEQRTSGFMLWQLAEAEYYFTNTYFPDFGGNDLIEAIEDFTNRERRFGGDSSGHTR